jgi:hypothetical protein
VLIIVMLVLVGLDSLISFKSGRSIVGLALETCVRRSEVEENVRMRGLEG